MGRRDLMMLMGATLGMMAQSDLYRTSIAADEDQIRFSDKCKSLMGEPVRELKEFSVNGVKVMAYSKKDAITRARHLGHIKKKKQKKK